MMITQHTFEKVVSQINAAFDKLEKRFAKLEEELKAQKATPKPRGKKV